MNGQKQWATRAGAERKSDAESFEQELVSFIRKITLYAIESETDAYTPTIRHLLLARKALQRSFG